MSFLLSAVLVFVGLSVRLTIEESPVFAEARHDLAARKKSTSMPIVEVFKHYPREILIAMGMRLAENISYYIFTVISITYLKDFLGLTGQVGVEAVLIGSLVQVALIPVVGHASDRLGRRPFYLFGAVGVGVWGFVFFGMLDPPSGTTVALAVTNVVIALLGDVNDPNHIAVGIYMTAAAALTIVAVLFSRETRGESLEHTAHSPVSGSRAAAHSTREH